MPECIIEKRFLSLRKAGFKLHISPHDYQLSDGIPHSEWSITLERFKGMGVPYDIVVKTGTNLIKMLEATCSECEKKYKVE